MYDLTFMEAKRPLVKQFTTQGVVPYPMMKTLKTHRVSVDPTDLDATLETFQLAATRGYALLKGHTKRPLDWESRAGQTDSTAKTTLLVIDIDGMLMNGTTINVPCDSDDLKLAAERMVGLLPPQFQDVSYIAHASSSFGMKGNKISLHLFFFLDTPVSPRALRPYLTHLNFENEHLQRSIQLSGSTRSLTYVLDPCLADNSRMIFLGHPKFHDGTEDPFPDPEHRLIAVKKQKTFLHLEAMLYDFQPAAVAQVVNKHIRRLRTALDLPDTRTKTQSYYDNGITRTVIANPSQGDNNRMTIHMDHGDYVTYNIGDGDSHAYYVRKDNPTIVWNFKGETPFVFQAADPEAYQNHLKEFGIKQTEGEATLMPFVFRDMAADWLYTGLWNPVTQEFEMLNPTQRANVDDFIIEKGGVMPDNIPQWTMEFNPKEPRAVDFTTGYLNTFKEPRALKNLAEIPDQCRGIEAGDLPSVMPELCPNIHTVIHSLVGGTDPEYTYFLNWLAYALQRREKTGTAWLFHGTQGTGKGLFIHKILMPLMDHRYTTITRLGDLEDQFNSWMETSMFVCVDEIRIGDSSQASKIMNKVKNYITEPTGTVRLMRQNPKQVKLWANFLFFTNERDPLHLTADDRRFNVGFRQEVSLKDRYGEDLRHIIDGLEPEIPRFASLLMQLEVDDHAATTPLDNIAKRALQETSEDSIDAFVKAVMNGDLEYFMSVMEDNNGAHNPDFLLAARNLFRSWLRDFAESKATKIWTTELKPFYNILVGKMDTDHKFAKLMGHRGIETKSIRREGITRKGIIVEWKLEDNDLEALQARYLGNVEPMQEARTFRP